MQRAVWTAAEILADYQDRIASFDLEPGADGEFEFSIDGVVAYSKRETHEFPDVAALKDAVVQAVDKR